MRLGAYKIFNLVFPPRFWSGNFFLIARFPDNCLLVPFHMEHPEEGGTKFCVIGPGHMTKMAARAMINEIP